MNLNIDEITNLLNTWNSWYLLEHDSYLASEWSENVLEITIGNFDVNLFNDEEDNLVKTAIEDLREYTDFVDTDNPQQFKVKFIFDGGDHQAREVFEALRPILEKAAGSQVIIENSMEFISPEIYSDPVLNRLAEMAQKEENKESKEGEDSENNQEEDDGGTPPPVEEIESESGLPPDVEKYSLKITGQMEKGLSVEIDQVLLNGGQFDDLDIFMEASRMYGTIEMNFEPPKGVAGTNPFECHDHTEARAVSELLGEVTDFRPRLVRENVLETGAMPEELAAAITYHRYKDRFKLFENPRAIILRMKRRDDISSTRKSLHKSCQMMLFLLMGAALLLIWWMSKKGR